MHASSRLQIVDEANNHMSRESDDVVPFSLRCLHNGVKIATKLLRDPIKLIHVQLARVEFLAQAGFIAEAASTLAGVLGGGVSGGIPGIFVVNRCTF